jgi:hypothetical protein
MVGKDARRWTAEHRAGFLRALAGTGTVKGACAAIGKSVAGAHYRRQREPDFAEAWDHVLGRVKSAWAGAREVAVVVPATGRLAGYRVRHDGWTPARQKLFLTALSQTGCVRDACLRAAISDTSAYRWRRKSKRFATAWERALRKARPTIEAEAYRRAVEGWDEAVIRNGEVVSVKRRYSDSLLRTLLTREAGRGAGAGKGEDVFADLELKRWPGERESEWLERRARGAAKAAGGQFFHRATEEETNAALMKQLAMLKKTMVNEVAEAERFAKRVSEARASRAAADEVRAVEGEVLPPEPRLGITRL